MVKIRAVFVLSVAARPSVRDYRGDLRSLTPPASNMRTVVVAE